MATVALGTFNMGTFVRTKLYSIDSVFVRKIISSLASIGFTPGLAPMKSFRSECLYKKRDYSPPIEAFLCAYITTVEM